MTRRYGALLLIVTLVAGACAGSSGESATSSRSPPSSEDRPEPSTAPAAVDPPGDPAGRLVVIDEAGAITTMLPDGTDVVALTPPSEARLQLLQPTWAPDASRIVWTEVNGIDGPVVNRLVTARPDGSGRTETDVPFAPFYLSWSPDGARVAYLGTGPDRLQLGILDVVGGSGDEGIIDEGQPYYFAWSSDGTRYLAHVGTERLDIVGVDGSIDSLGVEPGPFQSPAWTDDLIAYTATDAGKQYLVAGGLDSPRRIKEFDGVMLFLLDPPGGRIAYQVSGSGPDAVTASFRGSPVAQATGGGLNVVDLTNGDTTTVTLDPAVAFFWGPDGRLLSLHTEPGDPHVWFRWRVWDGTSSTRFERFLPSARLARDYLPFFDQYAKSLTFWSPDAAAFVYAGTGEDGRRGIWVQRAEAGTPPELIGPGVFASWSPAG